MKTRHCITILCVCLIAGCALAEPKIDDAGKTYTDIEQILRNIGGAMQGVGTFVPGWGTLIGGAGGLLSMIGGAITSIVMVRKRGSALDTVIKGVEEAATTYDNMKVLLLTNMKGLLKEEDYMKMESALAQTTSIKEIIQKVAMIIGTEPFLHKRVKSIS